MSEVENQPQAEAVVPVVETTTEAPVTKPNSNQLLDLAKREAQFRKQEVLYKTKLAEAQEELKELQYFRSAKDTYSADPEQLLSKLGISYEDLTKNIIQFYENAEANKKQPTVEELRKEIAKEFEQRDADKYKSAQNDAITGFQNEIGEFVKTNADKFPHLSKLSTTLAGSNSTEDFIFQVVNDYFTETGELLDLDTAASNAELYFQDEWQKLNNGLSPRKESTPAPAVQSSTPRKAMGDTITEYADITSGKQNKFREKLQASPSLNNQIPVNSPVSFKSRRLEREELINRAIASYDGAKTKK